jgi:hypothetical protein
MKEIAINGGRVGEFTRRILPLVSIIYAVAMFVTTLRVYARTEHPGVTLFFVVCTASFYIICYNALALEVSFKLWLQRNYPMFRNLSIAVAVVLATIPIGVLHLMQPKDAPKPGSSQAASVAVETPSPPVDAANLQAERDGKSDHTTVLTDIRYWSGKTSTIVGIDLDEQAQYEIHRLTAPDRIYLDLLGSKLDRALRGRRFQNKDALLRKIRVAEHEAHLTRVTLETNSLCDYSVTPIPNSYRLLIELRNSTRSGVNQP